MPDQIVVLFHLTAVLLTNLIVKWAVRVLISLFIYCNTLEHGVNVSRYVAFLKFLGLQKVLL